MSQPQSPQRRVHMIQLPIEHNFTDQVEQLLAKMEALQAENESLREENKTLQSRQGNATYIVTDDEGNILADQSDAGWEHYFPEASWHRSDSHYD
jgi:hypothetical protein